MKKIIIILLINLWTAIFCYSEDIYPKKLNDSLVIITSHQLKLSNLKFLELDKEININKQLNNKIILMDSIIKNQNKIDSINVTKIQSLEQINKTLNKNVKKNKVLYFCIGSGIGISIGTLLMLIVR